MNSDPNNSSGSPVSTGGEEVLQSLARQQRRLRWLTAAAVTLWALALIASVGVLMAYTLFISPKEQAVLEHYGAKWAQLPPGSEGVGAMGQEREAISHGFIMTFVLTKGILILAVSIVILSLGTFATVLLVVFNRRVTLRQINHNLAQISEQLRALQAKGAA